jgi:N-acetylglucosaminyldiphosphoundecaprenol N-acetyl-beta-D-mannosaminyltransferase
MTTACKESTSKSLLVNQRVLIRKIPIDPIDLSTALGRVSQMIRDGKRHYICFCEANLLYQASSRQDLRLIMQQADLDLADGIAISLLARLHNSPLPSRIPGPSFMLAACEYGLARGWKHFFLGGAETVPERLADRLKTLFPNLQVAGTFSPPFRPASRQEDRELQLMIESAGPDLLWVGLGGPKQELWMGTHCKHWNIPVMLGVGAAFDFHSGARPWAPAWIRHSGTEWLFRSLTGGPRLFRRNALCVSHAALLLLQDLCYYWKFRT